MNQYLFKPLVYLEYLESGLALPRSPAEDVSISQKRRFRKIFKKHYKQQLKSLSPKSRTRFIRAYGSPGVNPSPIQKRNRENFIYQKICISVRKKYDNRSVL